MNIRTETSYIMPVIVFFGPTARHHPAEKILVGPRARCKNIYITSYCSMWHLRQTSEAACWGGLTWYLISKALTLLSLYCYHSFSVLTLLKGNPLNLQRARHLTPVNHNTPFMLQYIPAGLHLWFQECAGRPEIQLPSFAFQWPAAAEVPFDLFL